MYRTRNILRFNNIHKSIAESPFICRHLSQHAATSSVALPSEHPAASRSPINRSVFCARSHQRLNAAVYGSIQIRFQSTNSTTTDATATPAAKAIDHPLVDGYIPAPPSALPADEAPAHVLNSLGEQTFSSLGLNNYTPTGFFQFLLENIHVWSGVPWWGTIIIGTLCMRLCVLPVWVKTQRASRKTANLMPTFTALLERQNEAKASGDVYEVMRATEKVSQFQKVNNYNPLSSMMMIFVQAPIFISMITALRGMAQVPVPGLQTGGVAWITNLVEADPYYILPIVTTLTLATMVEVGSDSTKAAHMKPMIRWGMRALPFVMLPILINMPGAVVMYWTTNNFVSLGQAVVLRSKGVREYLSIPEFVPHEAAKWGPQMGGSKPSGMRGAYDNFKAESERKKHLRQLTDRHRNADKAWQKAGTQPLVKTYRTDPTKEPKATATS